MKMLLSVPRSALLISFVLLSAGCAHIVPQYPATTAAELRSQIIPEIVSQPSPLLVLSKETKLAIEQRISHDWSDRRKMLALRDYLYEADELNIRFSSNQTKTAEQTFVSRSGNCISLTSLFIAAARHFDLDAHYQTVKVKPTWDQSGITMIRYEHIVATGRLQGKFYIMDFLPNFTLDGMNTKQITDQEALALYYNNLGVEQLLVGELNDARVYMQQSLALNVDNSDAWNNIGAIFKRLDETSLAEFSYTEAVALDAANFSSYSNLISLYQTQNRTFEAQKLEQKVKRYRNRNPYYFLYLARQSYQLADFDLAKRQLRRAIRLKRNEPEFHLALAAVNRAQLTSNRYAALTLGKAKGKLPSRLPSPK